MQTELTSLLGVILVIVGLFGAVLPVLPGSPFIFLGALLYDYGAGWTEFGWLWLGLLLLLMVAAEAAEWWLTNMGAKAGGASWQAMLAGFIGGLLGLFLPPFGFLIGALVGVIGVEFLRSRSAGQATKAGGGWFLGWALSLIVQVMAVVTMTGIFVWRVIS